MLLKKDFLIKKLSKFPLKFAFTPFYSGVGTILFMHKIVVSNNDKTRISLMKANEITTSYLEEIILYLKKKNYIFISLDEMLQVLKEKRNKSKKKFIVFTFDDGYKDNLTLGYPIFKKYKIPFTIYITNCYPNKTAKLWWYMLEDILLNNRDIEIKYGSKKLNFITNTLIEKDTIFYKIRNILISSTKENQEEIILNLEKKYNLKINDYVASQSLTWSEIKRLSDDDLVTIGCHTQNHYALNTLNKVEILDEIKTSKIEIENYIKKEVNHFAYPFGTNIEVGKREVEIIEKSNLFLTATTTRMGNIFNIHNEHLYTLPRIQVLGNQLETSILSLYLSGLLPAIKNKFKRKIKL